MNDVCECYDGPVIEEVNGSVFCQACGTNIENFDDEPDFDEPEIDFDACDRESASIHDFYIQERY